jgi:hypothetical protein
MQLTEIENEIPFVHPVRRVNSPITRRILIQKKEDSTRRETMKEPIKNKEVYEQPVIEVVEFELEDSIATSGQSVVGLACGEETY